MTTRPNLLATVLATLLAAPAAAQRSQDPDSLAYRHIHMPADPLEYVRNVERWGADGLGFMDVRRMYEAGGCASDGGWTTVAIDAFYRIAETDVPMRDALAWQFGLQLQIAKNRPESSSCPADLPAFDAWLRNALRRDWETGVVSVKHNGGSTTLGLIFALENSQSQETNELLLAIALDPEVWDTIRVHAAYVVMGQRVARIPGVRNMTQEERQQSHFDVIEAMLREYGDDLPWEWVSENKHYLRWNGRTIG